MLQTLNLGNNYIDNSPADKSSDKFFEQKRQLYQ